jgi:sRNA-binding carbon storage regulator CsrA
VLVLTRKVGERVDVRDPKTGELLCSVSVGAVRGGRVQLLFEGRADVPVLRGEIPFDESRRVA